MTCPDCGYMMTAFDAECPRCARIGIPKKTSLHDIPTAMDESIPQSIPENRPSQKRFKPLFICAFVFAVGAIGIFFVVSPFSHYGYQSPNLFVSVAANSSMTEDMVYNACSSQNIAPCSVGILQLGNADLQDLGNRLTSTQSFSADHLYQEVIWSPTLSQIKGLIKISLSGNKIAIASESARMEAQKKLKEAYFARYQELVAEEEQNRLESQTVEMKAETKRLQGASAAQMSDAYQPLFKLLDQKSYILQRKIAIYKHMLIQFPDSSSLTHPDTPVAEDSPVLIKPTPNL